jgi:hypothetical protein
MDGSANLPQEWPTPTDPPFPPIPLITPVEPGQPLSYDTFPRASLENLALSQDMITNIRNARLEDDIDMMLNFSISFEILQETFPNSTNRLRSPLSCSVPWLLTQSRPTRKHVVYSTKRAQTALFTHTGL